MKKYSRTQIYTKEEGDNYVLAANIRIRTSLFMCTRLDEQPNKYSRHDCQGEEINSTHV